MDTSATLLALLLTTVSAALVLLAGYALGRSRARSAADAPDLVAVETALDRLGRRLDEAESLRRADQAGMRAEIGEQLRHVEATAEVIRRETGSLATALGRVDVRGRWGEAHLRRLVEAAGMLEHVDFIEQDTRSTDDGAIRPDLVVDLGAGRCLVVDAKVPLAALLEAESTDETSRRSELFGQHARDVAAHLDRLGAKDYWRRYDGSLDAVVLFLPAESMLGIALHEDPTLLDRAFARGVIVATPTTLLALLRTVAHVWRREAIADNAREIHALGRELYERLGTFLDHVRRMGSSLDAAVSHYNRAVGSLEGRLLVSARRLCELGVGDSELTAPEPITQRSRDTGPSELKAAIP
ncbi:MAG: DNA recombination protein RmuC [Candidatus Nanopelagicales bacterium]|jgi:DNA recombination protein RmuC